MLIEIIELLVLWSSFLLNNEVISFRSRGCETDEVELVKHLLTIAAGRVESCANVLCSGEALRKVCKYSV